MKGGKGNMIQCERCGIFDYIHEIVCCLCVCVCLRL